MIDVGLLKVVASTEVMDEMVAVSEMAVLICRSSGIRTK